MNNVYTKIESELKSIGAQCLINEPMSKHTTFGIGGPVDLMIMPKDNSQISRIIKSINKYNIKFYFLGSGSNILISDNGIRGAVISLKKSSKKIIFYDSTVLVECGVMLGTLVKELNSKNIIGFESLMGVPGTVGGAIIMNAGAFGAEISNNLISVNTINIKGEVKKYLVNDINFSYRYSNFPDDEILIDAIFKCNIGDKEIIHNNKNNASTLRKKNQPLTYRSAGSIFKNPTDVAAGYLIDKAGLKGMKIGNAQISEKHANFIVNLGGAKCNEVLELIKIIKNKIYNSYDIKLELEVKIIGENSVKVY
tara:strand:+ start:21156 stop:22082 length:927 start_codon:yes stop_codon:yes gene_type:complete